MKCIKQQFILFASFAFATLLTGCSNDDKDPITPPVDPVDPTLSIVPLTQFEVLLSDQTTSSKTINRSDMEEFNHPKTVFLASDHFTFSYSNSTQASQKAYAYTSDGKTWTVHEKEDANSPVKTIQLDAKSPSLSATFLSETAINAGADKDGIVTENGTNGEVTVGCFDALRTTAEVMVSNNKATAKVPFKHVNHLLNFHVKGTITENFIDHLILNVTYTNAAGTQQNALLRTSSRAGYADANGTVHTVLQAIVPRNAVVKNIQAVKRDDSFITTSEVVSINCPSGKSHLVTLNINDNTLSLQVGALMDDWTFGGEMNPDGSPVGNIYIGTPDELRGFASAVNINPNSPAAKINGILAYTAHVVQTADIDLSSLAWRPIGGQLYKDSEGNDKVTYFAGTYNGNGYKISGMKVTSSTASNHSLATYAGMFGNMQSPAVGYTVLTHIQLVNVSIELRESVDYVGGGALVAYAYAPMGKKPIIISQCTAQGMINVTNSSGLVAAGGLVGEAIRTHITGSFSDVSVTTNATAYSYAGGIAGRIQSSTIASSYAKKAVSGQSSNGTSVTGGIAGSLSSQNEYSYILACSAEGDVTSNGKEAHAGGVAGYNSGNITGCYSKGNASATGSKAKSGAIVGTNADRVDLCYGVGTVGVGTSGLTAQSNNIIYKTNPAADNILSIVSGKSWKDANGSEIAEATVGGILTTISVNTGGKLVEEVKPRLWVLSDVDVWTTTSPASNIYPLPTSNYKGQ